MYEPPLPATHAGGDGSGSVSVPSLFGSGSTAKASLDGRLTTLGTWFSLVPSISDSGSSFAQHRTVVLVVPPPLQGPTLDDYATQNRCKFTQLRTAENSLAAVPEYCKDITVIKIDNIMTTKDVLHLAAMTVTVSIACCALVALATLVYSIFNLTRTAVKTAAASSMYENLRAEVAANTRVLLSAKSWVPPHPYVCVNLLHENDNARAYVIHNFVPESPCELYLKKGDIITEVEVLKDGWCKGKLNGTLGFFPLSYVKMTKNN
ncbi:hypothetical protein EMCRGX_G027937 [Ephydatia muelleri]